MHLMTEDLARAHMAARVDHADRERLAHRLVRARRLSRKAERAARLASLALARLG